LEIGLGKRKDPMMLALLEVMTKELSLLVYLQQQMVIYFRFNSFFQGLQRESYPKLSEDGKALIMVFISL
jgi:hypothetical protein